MTEHAVASREEWLAERHKLLENEKEHTRRGDELARERRELPWVQIEKAPARIHMKQTGATLVRMLHRHRPSFHHAHKQRTTGSTTVDDLLAIARAAKSKVRE